MVSSYRVAVLVLFCATTVISALSNEEKVAQTGDYENVTMQCVSEFNWNQGTETSYKSATGYFVSGGGNIATSSIPDCAGGWSSHNDTLVLKGNKQPRMLLKDASGDLLMLDLSSKDVSWTQSVAQLGRNFNGALYSTWVRPQDESNPPNAARLYCDANDGTGNDLWCPEMDLSESNICGFRSTSHPVTDLSSKNWTDSAVNCHLPLDADVGSYYDNSTRAWVKSADHTNLFYCGLQADGAQHLPTQTQSWVDHYGNGLYFTSQSAAPSCVDGADSTKCHYGAGETIDTTRDYDVRVTFDWNPKGYLNGFTTTLSQGSNSLTISRQTSPNAANVPSAGGFPLDGRVALLVQLWTSSHMSWLAGPTCKYINGESGLPPVDDATFTMKNIRITDRISGAQSAIYLATVE